MKILYGVQGTGNGHITRARHLVNALASDPSLQVDYFFSGRKLKDYFDMECFGNYLGKPGLTFHTTNGTINYKKTLLNNNLIDFMKDVNAVDVGNYDLVLNDFEPITAWASKLQGVPSISISHQAALLHPIPNKKPNLLNDFITRFFAPTSQTIGTHWYHFGYDVIPPFVAKELVEAAAGGRKKSLVDSILVYLPFEELQVISEHLVVLSEYQFICFHPLVENAYVEENIAWYPPSTTQFKRHLISCDGVICNAGFELSTECLTLGKPLLIKPLRRQYEQMINANTLKMLGLAKVIHSIDSDAIQDWLLTRKSEIIGYSSDTRPLVNWLKSGNWNDTKELCDELWEQVIFPNDIKSQLNSRCINRRTAAPLQY
ncbi:MJ1255/VC2487 family glycosyltransferase [Glaciecola petra]|uniref:Glycosyltransferase family protein n=1 Tax=Glaciecola petra TaxID=3075602 RepID=A0ABU2ZTM9_9ALTE|nr:MJ1255/VC2487 family glycosyltransferase [Aestuariibacter sp. P117]MDT0595674.1 glycosyltransferase family protein [Aestuariibacter sp. P117]